jgi:predicted enzyme related to lactoylglutathione lyase
MPNPHGSWIWYELLTSDVDAAQAFYEKVVGWSIAPFPGEPGIQVPMDYRILSAPDGDGVGGMMTLPEGAPMPPAWMGYFGVGDVDATVATIEDEGGKTFMPATDMPGVGRIAMMADPQGVAFYVMKGASDQPSKASARREMGHCSWNELIAPDDTAAISFYERVFGITKVGAMPMGAMGDYSFLQAAGAEEPFGAVMKQQANQPMPAWVFYFRVPDIDAAIATVKAEGGQIVTGPHDVPGGEKVILAIDPQGAAVGFVAPPKA